MLARVKSVIRHKRTVVALVGIAAIVSHLFVFQGGYSMGFDSGWSYGRLEARLDLLENSYLPAEPDSGSVAENAAR